MSTRPRPLPETLGRVFTFREAHAAGTSRRRLQHLDLEHPFVGVYRRTQVHPAERQRHSGEPHPHPAVVWREQQMHAAAAFLVVMPDEAFFAGATAAALWNLPVGDRRSGDLDVGVFTPHRAIRRRGVRGVQFARHMAAIDVLGGQRVLSPASVWATMGTRLSTSDLVALGDAVVRVPRIPGTHRFERPPLSTVDELRACAEVPRRPGALALRVALPFIVTSAASAPESHLRLRLAAGGFPPPELDFDVRDELGRLIGCSEIAYPEFKVAIEYEGEHHRVLAPQWNRDIEKYHDYGAAGWCVVRVTADLLYRQPHLLRSRVDQALRRGGWAG